MAVKKSGGTWSFTRVLLITAVVGAVAGVLLARSRQDDRPPEEIAEEEVNKVMIGNVASDSTAMDPDPRSLDGIPAYPNASPRKLTSTGTIAGAPMAVSWFQTVDPPDRVLAYYAKAFEAENRVAVAQQFSPTMGYIGWMEDAPDGGAGLLHMVSVSKQYSRTMVLLSASYPEMILDNQVALPGGLQLPPNSSKPQMVKLGEGAMANDVVYARVSNMSGPDFVSFFERQFKERDFAITESTSTAAQFSIVGAKAGTSIVVGARNEGAHLSVVITYSRNQPQEAFP
jgi:hypothetical protein